MAKVKEMKDGVKWRVKKVAGMRGINDALRLRDERNEGEMGGWKGKKREEGGGKEKAEGWVGRWWGYDELKMTLSGSLVSKDHSVC